MPSSLPSQQGSRAGLITALVIFIIGFLISTIFLIRNTQQWDKDVAADKAQLNKYKDAVTDLTSDEYTKALHDRDAWQATSAFDAVDAQRQALARTITGIQGKPVPTSDAQAAAKGALEQANKILSSAGITPADRGLNLTSSQSLVSAVVQYADAYAKLDKERKDALARIDALQKEKAALAQANQEALTAKDKQIADANANTAKAQGQYEAYVQQKDAQITQLTQQTSQQIKALSDAVAAQQAIVAQKDQELGKNRTLIAQLTGALKPYRMDPKENIVRQPDGNITRVTGDGFCYIDRGAADHVPVGLTFEVYDKSTGIPPLGDGMAEVEAPKHGTVNAATVTNAVSLRGGSPAKLENGLPKGKASIEVVNVGAGHTSQCRIIRVDPGQTLSEGDIIANLVYDPNHHLNFALYGDFDLDGNGIATSGDTAVIRRLIEQWGGHAITIHKPEDLTVDTDFLVMGMEPKIPSGDATDPQVAEAITKAKAAYDAYNAVRGRASDLTIPIMNQNRFLYYVGYYDQKTR